LSTFFARGAGELLTDEAPRRVEVKADREALAVTESRPGSGPAADVA
jgi:hypothetical protein